MEKLIRGQITDVSMEEIRRVMEKLSHGQITEESMEEIRRVMPKKKLMVFVSSTFLDTNLERDILHKNILPCLQAMGRQYGIQVILYDMRFGVTDENTLDHMTWVNCKDSIQQCFEGSDGLFFLSLQADRYGGRFLPKYLNVDSATEHKNVSACSEMTKNWYTLDENHRPPRYELKHLTSLDDSDYRNKVLPSLRDSDLDSVPFEAIPGLPKTNLLVNRSVTEWETLYALGCDKERCHWIQRSFSDDYLHSFSSNPDCSKLTDVIENPVSARKLEDLQAKMKEHLKDDHRTEVSCGIRPEDFLKRERSEEYSREWEVATRTCLEKEMEKVILKCNRWNKGCFYGIPEDHMEEIVHHCSTAFTKSRRFFGREELLKRALEKIKKSRTGENKLLSGITLAVIGKSGCGKTTMMSRLALSCHTLLKKEIPLIIRYCGTSKYSLTGLKLIQGISLQLLAAHGKNSEVEAILHILPTQSYKAAMKQFQILISQYPVVLFIDSLDQLENSNEERRKLSFLRDIRPHKQSKIVVSTLPDEYDQNEKHWKYFYQCESLLKAEHVPVEEVGLIDQVEIEATIRCLLDSRQRNVTPDQLTVVLNAVSHEPTVLYINLAVEVISKWRSFDTKTVVSTVKGIINQILEGLEKSFGIAFTSTAFAMITYSREGIDDVEMQDLLSLHEGVLKEVFQYSTSNCFPIHVWLRLKQAIRRLVTEKENRCTKWFHRQLHETAIERYSKKEKECNLIMGRYFSNIVDEQKRKEKRTHEQLLILNDVSIWLSSCSVNRRRVIEGYYHLIEGGLFEEAIDEMCSVEFVCASGLCGDLFNVARQMGKVKSLFNGAQNMKRKLDHYFRWIKRRSSLITSNPSWMTRSTAGEEPTESEVNKQYFLTCMESLQADRGDEFSDWDNCDVFTITGKTVFDGFEVEFAGHSASVKSVAWNHDGSKVASGSEDGKVLIWDGKTGELCLSLDGHRDTVTLVKWNHDSSQLISVSNATIVISNARTGELLKTLKGKRYVYSVAWNEAGSKVVSGRDTMVDIWDVREIGRLLTTLKGHTSSVTTVSWSHDGLKILSGSEDQTIKIWDAVNRKVPVKTLKGHSSKIVSAAWNHDDSKIVSGSWDWYVKIWDARTGGLINSIDVHSSIVSLAWGRVPGSIVLANDRGQIQTLNETTGMILNSYPMDYSYHMDWNHDQSQLVSTKNNSCWVWNISSTELKRNRVQIDSPGCYVAWNSDETMVVTASSWNPVVWDAKTGTYLRVFKTDSKVVSVAWNYDDSKILVIKYYGKDSVVHSAVRGDITVWDVKTSKLLNTTSCDCFTELIAWNSQKNMIASISPETEGDGKLNQLKEKKKKLKKLLKVEKEALKKKMGKKTITICNTNTGELIKSFHCDTGEVKCLAWSRDDTKIVSGGSHSILIWSVETGNLLNGLTELESIQTLTWNHDDTKIVAGGMKGAITILNGLTGELLKSWKGHSAGISCVVWRHDGQGIVSGSSDKTIKIWDAITGELNSTLMGHTNEVCSLNWSRDGSKILSGSSDGTVKIWITGYK
jgi:WD40 repeat protein/GTPase SAR1 family protein